MTTKEAIKVLLRTVRDELSGVPHRTMFGAVQRIAETAYGDPDTADIASTILNLVIRAHTESDSARASAWSERQDRTYAEITALLHAGAQFARLYGPATTGSQAV